MAGSLRKIDLHYDRLGLVAQLGLARKLRLKTVVAGRDRSGMS